MKGCGIDNRVSIHLSVILESWTLVMVRKSGLSYNKVFSVFATAIYTSIVLVVCCSGKD